MKLRSGRIVLNKIIIKKDKNIDKLCNLFKKIKLKDEIDEIDEIDELIILMKNNTIVKNKNKNKGNYLF
jgi:hypothetical protein